jgi:hypothetical protein
LRSSITDPGTPIAAVVGTRAPPSAGALLLNLRT